MQIWNNLQPFFFIMFIVLQATKVAKGENMYRNDEEPQLDCPKCHRKVYASRFYRAVMCECGYYVPFNAEQNRICNEELEEQREENALYR